jgi:hypothetical protein
MYKSEAKKRCLIPIKGEVKGKNMGRGEGGREGDKDKTRYQKKGVVIIHN